MMRLITAQVDSEQWYKFKTVCKRNKTNASKEIRKLVEETLKEDELKNEKK